MQALKCLPLIKSRCLELQISFEAITDYFAKLHPFCQQRPIVEYCKTNNIIVQAYCPIIRGRMDNSVIHELSQKVKYIVKLTKYVS